MRATALAGRKTCLRRIRSCAAAPADRTSPWFASAALTTREIAETIYQMSMFAGLPAMQKALEIAASVYDEEDEA